MGPNAAILIDLALKAAIQIQQYQLAVMKANAEGRDVTEAELDSARQAAITAVDNLEQQP
jgi:hypothetical protein